jgi:hypothetical protein
MFGLKVKLHGILNEMKKFAAGYSSSDKNAMIIKFEDKVYLAEFTALGEGEVSDYMNYLK